MMEVCILEDKIKDLFDEQSMDNIRLQYIDLIREARKIGKYKDRIMFYVINHGYCKWGFGCFIVSGQEYDVALLFDIIENKTGFTDFIQNAQSSQ